MGVKVKSERFTSLDKSILGALCKYRALTVSQLKRLCFDNEPEQYHYRKLDILKRRGYVVSFPEIRRSKSKTRKIAACYYLAEYGYEKMKREGLFMHELSRSRLSAPLSRHEQTHRIEANEILVEALATGVIVDRAIETCVEVAHVKKDVYFDALVNYPPL
ncbi:replication-relaxation family protein, partial [Aneurinibacillus thermoaerophilus]|uniref:replication-relaxation family protein n=1 Tax=Aneurinibacillus thermoaerophilus TaxID=143495 RepID=UPI002E21257A|nr:replication-relaxation family protein [Aneurinibacillus thermoaerophilus]